MTFGLKSGCSRGAVVWGTVSIMTGGEGCARHGGNSTPGTSLGVDVGDAVGGRRGDGCWHGC